MTTNNLEDSDARLQLCADRVIWRLVGEEVVGLETLRSEYLAVNRSGVELWQALANGASQAELVRLLMERWQLDEERATRDARAFLSQLADRELLEPAQQ
jgi:hypothetical protein